MADPLAFFRELGARIGRLWEERGRKLDDFADVAHAALEETPVWQAVDPLDVLKLVVRTPGWSNQGTKESFGQPGIALFTAPAFQIEMLFWFEGTTHIHQHSFLGAFQVVTGSSVHGHHSFAIAEKLGADFYLGQSKLERIELLGRGDTRRILPGWRLNHSLFHLDHPSTTVVVRTHVRQEFLPQLSIFQPHVAIAEYIEDRPLRIRQRALVAAAEMDPAALEPLAEEAMLGADPRSLYILMSHYLSLQRDASKSGPVIERLRAKHGAKVDLYLEVVAEYRRTFQIALRRGQVRGPEHRFFMALLMNCPDRASVLELVGKRFPEAAPEATVARWLRELGDDPAAPVYAPLRR